MAEQTERHSTAVGQNAWERGEYSRLKLLPQAFSVCIVTDVSMEQTNQLLWLRKDLRGFAGAVVSSDLSLYLYVPVEGAFVLERTAG